MPFHALQSVGQGGTLGLWHLTEPVADLWPQLADAARYQPLLPARADGPRQAQWLAGRLLVQHLLQAAAPGAGLPLVQNTETGQPFLAGRGLQPALSLSHSGAWVAALLGPPGAALGVDVEQVRDKAHRLAPKFLNASELAATERLAPESADAPALYSLLWSAKETLYKLAGRRGVIFRENLLLDGLAGPLAAIGVLPARLQVGGCNSRHHICYLQPAAGYVLTYSLAAASA